MKMLLLLPAHNLACCRVGLGAGSLLSAAQLAGGNALAAAHSQAGLLPVLGCLSGCLQAAMEDRGEVVREAVAAATAWAAETGAGPCARQSLHSREWA